MIILVVGTIGSGKGIITDYFSMRGFPRLSFGDEVREELKRRGISENRYDLQAWGYDLKDSLAGRIFENIDSRTDTVVDGARYPSQIRQFFDRFERNNVKVVGVDAWYFLRGYRLMARGREGDPTSWAEFREQNERDLHGYLNGKGQDTQGCLEMSDYLLNNNFTIRWFEKKVERVIREICFNR